MEHWGGETLVIQKRTGLFYQHWSGDLKPAFTLQNAEKKKKKEGIENLKKNEESQINERLGGRIAVRARVFSGKGRGFANPFARMRGGRKVKACYQRGGIREKPGEQKNRERMGRFLISKAHSKFGENNLGGTRPIKEKALKKGERWWWPLNTGRGRPCYQREA